MSAAADLAHRLTMDSLVGGSVDWRKVREEIHDALDAATMEADRVLCLALHKTIMDAVERNAIEPDKLSEFRKMRGQDYNLLLIKEAMIGRTDGNIPPDRMAAITRREVAAGRMAPDDELHQLALSGDMLLSSPPARPKMSIGGRIASWFR